MLFGADQTEIGWQKLLKDPKVVDAVKGTLVYKVSHHGRDVGLLVGTDEDYLAEPKTLCHFR